MSKLSINDAEMGMVLAADVKDRGGRILLKAGVELSEKHLKVFKTWGVAQIEVEGDDDVSSTGNNEVSPELLDAADEEARQLFQHADLDHPLFKELIPLWKKQFIRARS